MANSTTLTIRVYLVTGEQAINGSNYFFLPNGVMFTDGVIKNAKGQSMVYGKSGKLTTQTGWKEVTVKDDSGKEEKFYQYFSRVASWLLV